MQKVRTTPSLSIASLMIFFNNAVGFGVSNVVAEIQNLLFPLFIRRYVIPVIGRWLPFTVMRVR
ncbi:hypothetical protein KCP75_00325 [Salmonella enterica subsp. enterica]|nr:hypothetical protein KCP75_00325 [Salmonella enterica subsp. enterica]